MTTLSKINKAAIPTHEPTKIAVYVMLPKHNEIQPTHQALDNGQIDCTFLQ